MRNLNQEIINHLKTKTIPVHVEEIRVACHIGNWNTALKHCLELLLTSQIAGQQTSHGWIFWTNQKEVTT